MFQLEIKKSNIDGRGIFTINFIPKSAVFYKVPLDSVHSAPRSHCARVGEDRYVNDGKVLNWVNHSCDPNARLDIAEEEPRLIALKDIQPNEEITCDYNLTEMGGVKIKCECGKGNCRGYFLSVE